MTVRRIRALAVAVVLWFGCGSDAPSEVEAWADRACACADAECAGRVRGEFTAWVEQQRSLRGSRSERVRIEKATMRLFKCIDQRGAAREPTSAKPPGPEGEAAEEQAPEEQAPEEQPPEEQPAEKQPAVKQPPEEQPPEKQPAVKQAPEQQVKP